MSKQQTLSEITAETIAMTTENEPTGKQDTMSATEFTKQVEEQLQALTEGQHALQALVTKIANSRRQGAIEDHVAHAKKVSALLAPALVQQTRCKALAEENPISLSHVSDLEAADTIVEALESSIAENAVYLALHESLEEPS